MRPLQDSGWFADPEMQINVRIAGGALVAQSGSVALAEVSLSDIDLGGENLPAEQSSR